MAAGRAKAAAATAPPATSAAKSPRSKKTADPLPLPCTERGLCCARSQQAVPGGVDRQGAQQVGVGLLVGGAADVQLVLHLLLGQVAAVALLQNAGPDGVPFVIGCGLAQGVGPALGLGAGLALDQLPVPQGGAALPAVFAGHGQLLSCWVMENLLQGPETAGLFFRAQTKQEAQPLGLLQFELAFALQPALQGGAAHPQRVGEILLLVAAGRDLCVQPFPVDHACASFGALCVD